MPTPLERLQKIIAAKTPSKVQFEPRDFSGHELVLQAITIQEGQETPITEDAQLQSVLKSQLRENYDRQTGQYKVDVNPDYLWDHIRNNVIWQYNEVSPRCEATRRKTEKFIYGIKLNDTHLANYVIQMFLQSKTETYRFKSKAEKGSIFEAFEGLRRTYGKRNR
jgi:hypothetical protein